MLIAEKVLSTVLLLPGYAERALFLSDVDGEMGSAGGVLTVTEPAGGK